MKILLVGNRAIQHALAIRLKLEGCDVHVYPGLKINHYYHVSATDILDNNYDLIVLGSARYFSDPSILELKMRGIPFFGPGPDAAELELSKEKFKEFAHVFNISTPLSQSYTDAKSAKEYIRRTGSPYVIKVDGLARGCGTTIAETIAEADEDISRKLADQTDRADINKILIEEYVEGAEVAVNVFFDDNFYVVLPPTMPHKRRDEGSKGPFVAGMGSVAPVRLNDSFYRELEKNILEPTLKGLRERGWYFRGCLFINLMLTHSGITVLEYNCRMGDPGMLADLLLLDSSLSELLSLTANNNLRNAKLRINSGTAVCVTLVSQNYPDEEDTETSFSLEAADFFSPQQNCGIVLAGAKYDQTTGYYVNQGGVVASAIARGTDFASAQRKAYELVGLLPKFRHRRDIGMTPLNLPLRYCGELFDVESYSQLL